MFTTVLFTSLLLAGFLAGALSAALNWYRANTSAQHFGQTQPWPVTEQIRCPVLGVWSTGDTALREPQMVASERFVAAGRWRYVRLEGVGHWIPREAPNTLNELLLQFIAGNDYTSTAAGNSLQVKSSEHCSITQTKSPVSPRARL